MIALKHSKVGMLEGLWIVTTIVAVASVYGQQPPAATKSASEVVDAVGDVFDRLRVLPAIRVEYRIDHQALEPSSSEDWAWKWGEYINIIRPSDPNKVYVEFRYPSKSPYDSKKEIIASRIYSLDGEIMVEVESSNEKRGDFPAAAAIMSPKKQLTTYLPLFSYYFRYLGHAVTNDPEAGWPTRTRYLPHSYWLPDAIRRNRDEYRVLPQQSLIGETWCHVIERANTDRMWVQLEPDKVAILRREGYWPNSDLMRHRIEYRDFKPVSERVWLPWTIEFTLFAPPWDNPALHHKPVYRHILRVSQLVADPVEDTTFRATIPEGAAVIDCVSSGPDSNRQISFVNRPGINPFEFGSEMLRAEAMLSRRRWPWRPIVVAVVVVVMLASVLLLIKPMQRRRGT